MPEPTSATGLTRLMRSSSALLDTTFDQLRTVIVVRETGTALAAARVLGRDQSSVQKQLDTLNRNFGELCGEPLVHKQGRGRNLLFTSTGEALVDLARTTLGSWLDGIHESRRQLGGTLSVGTTRYTLGYLATASAIVSEEFRERGIDLKIVHIRTRELVEKLRSNEVDLVCGSMVTTVGDDTALDAYDVLEWRRSGLVLLTNIDAAELTGPVSTSELPRLPLVVSTSGVITDFLRGWFGADYRNRMDITAEIDTAQYGFELLRSGMIHGCMLVTQGLGEAAVEGRLEPASELRTIELTNDLEPKLQLLAGVFTRRGERDSYDADHPLNLLWNALERNHAERS